MAAGMDPHVPSRPIRDPDAAVLALGAAVLAGIVAIDVAMSDTVSLTPWVLIAPMVIATRGTLRETGMVAASSFRLSIWLGLLNDRCGDAIHVSHMALVLIGGVLAVAA